MEQTLAERNKQLALKAFDALFNRHDYDAAATMWSEGLVANARPRCVVTNPIGSTLAEVAPSTPVMRREMP